MNADNNQNQGIETKLNVLIRLMALSLFSEGQTLKDRAVLLQKAGLEVADIADLCNTTRNTVSVALYAAKKVGKRKKGK